MMRKHISTHAGRLNVRIGWSLILLRYPTMASKSLSGMIDCTCASEMTNSGNFIAISDYDIKMSKLNDSLTMYDRNDKLTK